MGRPDTARDHDADVDRDGDGQPTDDIGGPRPVPSAFWLLTGSTEDSLPKF